MEYEAAADPIVPEPRRPSAAALFALEEDLRKARAEVQLARFAVPAALLGWMIVVQADLGRFLARTFCGMWLHEFGHAIAAWLCGYPAIPGPWFTTVGDRSFVFAGFIAAGLGYLAWRAWSEERRVSMSVAGGLLAIQLFFTIVLRSRTAETFITFSGDGGTLVLGAILMATFFVPPEHKLHRDWLRWGLLVIGAAGFADTFDEWRAARTDYDVIPFGEFEHGGPTDPTKLLDAGWTIPGMVGRYLALGLFCLAALAPLQYFHVQRTRARLEELEDTARRASRR